MRRLLLVAVLAVMAVPARAQVIDPNFIYTIGAGYALKDPGPGFNRLQLTVGSGLPGVTVSDNFLNGTLYVLSPGFGLRTVDAANGTVTGVGVSGGITYSPHAWGGQFAVQTGVFFDVSGANKSQYYFLQVGGSVTSHAAIQAKRLKKKQEKEKKATMPPVPDAGAN